MSKLKKVRNWLIGFMADQALAEFIRFVIPYILGGGGLTVIAVIASFFANIPWPYIIIIAIGVFILGTLSVKFIFDSRNASNYLRPRFCDSNGNITNIEPVVRYWKISNNLVAYYVYGFIKLVNTSFRERTIESACIILSYKKNVLQQKNLTNFHINKRIKSFDISKECENLSVQLLQDEYELQQLVGPNYGKVDIDLRIEATGVTGIYKFKTEYGLPIHQQIKVIDTSKEKEEIKSIKTRLGNLLLNGEIILAEIQQVDRKGTTRKDEDRLTGQVNTWISETIEILNKEREEDASYFLSNFGLEEPVTLRRVMSNRMIRLKTIFEKL